MCYLTTLTVRWEYYIWLRKYLNEWVWRNGRMILTAETECTQWKSRISPLCIPQILYGQAWDRTRAFAVRRPRLPAYGVTCIWLRGFGHIHLLTYCGRQDGLASYTKEETFLLRLVARDYFAWISYRVSVRTLPFYCDNFNHMQCVLFALRSRLATMFAPGLSRTLLHTAKIVVEIPRCRNST